MAPLPLCLPLGACLAWEPPWVAAGGVCAVARRVVTAGSAAEGESGGEGDGASDAHAHGGGGVEAVAFAADRGDEVGQDGELLAQAADVGVDGARIRAEVGICPDGGEELVAGDGAVGVGSEVCQEVVFLGAQAGVASVEGDLSAVDVNVGRSSVAGRREHRGIPRRRWGCRWRRGRRRQGC